VDKDCAKDSNVQCEDGLVCEGATAADTIGKCKVTSSATIPTYVGKDARCDPAECDRRLHLECKPVQTGTTTEKRCVQKAVAPIGGFCSNDKKESVADCSQFARCAENSGQCTRRKPREGVVLRERDDTRRKTIAARATPTSSMSTRSCAVRIAARLATTCHKALPQNLCSLH